MVLRVRSSAQVTRSAKFGCRIAYLVLDARFLQDEIVCHVGMVELQVALELGQDSGVLLDQPGPRPARIIFDCDLTYILISAQLHGYSHLPQDALVLGYERPRHADWRF